MFARHLRPRLEETLLQVPVVLVEGPRRVGKSTMLRSLVGSGGLDAYLTLGDRQTRREALTDPEGVLRELTGKRVALDDAHLAPNLLRVLVTAARQEPERCRWVLAGAPGADGWTALDGGEPPAVARLNLWPLAQSELTGRPALFLSRLMEPEPSQWTQVEGEPDYELSERVVRGGFPEAVAEADDEARAQWFADYLQQFGEAVTPRLYRKMAVYDLARLLKLLAERAGALVRYADLGREVELPPTTLRRYLSLFVEGGILGLVPAWGGAQDRRVVQAARLLFTDTGLTAQQLGLVELVPFHTQSRQLLETFVGAELAGQVAAAGPGWVLQHFRLHSGGGVSWVVQAPDGRVAGVDVRHKVTVAEEDFAGLKALRAHAAERCCGGVVLHTGRGMTSLAADLHALPVAALWSR